MIIKLLLKTKYKIQKKKINGIIKYYIMEINLKQERYIFRQKQVQEKLN